MVPSHRDHHYLQQQYQLLRDCLSCTQPIDHKPEKQKKIMIFINCKQINMPKSVVQFILKIGNRQ